jgi:hypothetical protein
MHLAQVHKIYTLRHSECTAYVLVQTQCAFIPPNNCTVHLVFPSGLKNMRERRHRHNQVIEYEGKLTSTQTDAYAGKRILSETYKYVQSKRHRHIEQSGEKADFVTDRPKNVQKVRRYFKQTEAQEGK